MTRTCKSIGCHHCVAQDKLDFCNECLIDMGTVDPAPNTAMNLARPIGDMRELDVFGVHYLFNIQDPSGCIQLASQRLLESGLTEANRFKAITEARDTLNRWLQLNEGLSV